MRIFQEHVHVKENKYRLIHRTFELQEVVLQTKQGLVRISNIYRPPYSKKNKYTPSAFSEELKQYMEELEEKPGSNIILGDFNIQFQKTELASTKCIREIVQTYGYRLVITEKNT